MDPHPFDRLAQMAERLADEGDQAKIVHKLRVALRRSRRFLKLRQTQTPAGKRLLKRLRRLYDDLSKIRRYDVFARLFLDTSGQARRKDAEVILQFWQAKRKQAVKAARLIAGLAKILPKLNRFKSGVEEAGSVPAGLAGLYKYLQKAARLSHAPEGSLQDLHRLRLVVKRMRDEAAWIAPEGWEREAALTLLQGLQTELGVWRDKELLAQALQRCCAKKRWDKPARQIARGVRDILVRENQMFWSDWRSLWPGRKARLGEFFKGSSTLGRRPAAA
jgi:CHAD domain-containing protein